MDFKMTLLDAVDALAQELEKHDWFFDAEPEGNAIVVYVDTMGSDVAKHIPDVFHGYQVKMAFSQYLTADEKYSTKTLEEAYEDLKK